MNKVGQADVFDPVSPSAQQDHQDSGADDTPPPPLTWGQMSRFFGVPLLIISMVVAGAILVVFLFGGPAAPANHTIDDLLTAVESATWQRSAGMLLPQEKDVLQKAIELSVRLEKKDRELTAEELEKVTSRLVTLIESQVLASESAEPSTLSPDEVAAHQRRMEFAIHALGRTDRTEAVAPLVQIVRQKREPYLPVAIQELGNLHELPQAHAATREIANLLSTSLRPETAMVAATALAVLAPRGDQQATSALKSLMFAHEGEVSWSAAMSLARLGDSSGTTILLDLLDRGFWESGDRFEVKDEKGVVRCYPMPPQRIEHLLIAAIDASSHLQDAALWDAIKSLESDRSPSVRRRAADALAQRTASAVGG